MKLLIEIDSTIIGIKLWLIPQISEHCPNKILILLVLIIELLIWPGIASILMFNEGIVHEWITSIDETTINTWVLKGIIILLSVSIKLKLNNLL